jgi:hypothetical protein
VIGAKGVGGWFREVNKLRNPESWNERRISELLEDVAPRIIIHAPDAG